VSSSDLSLSLGAALQHCSPNLGKSQCVRPPSRSASCTGGDCLGANSCVQAPSHSSWECFRLPHVPCMQITLWDVALTGRLCPSGSLTMARTAAFPRLMHRSLVSWVSPYWNWGCGLETTFLVYYHCLGYRGTRPPRLYRAASYCAASSTVIPIRRYRG